MKKTFIFLSAILLSISISCTHSPKKTSPNKEKASSNKGLEDRILDTIARVPEVQKRMAYVEKESKGKRHLQFMVDTPTKGNNYYSVAVQEDNGDAVTTHFNFDLYNRQGVLSIKFVDNLNDTTLTLEAWRKSKDYKLYQ